jgi:hypothetical protein
MVIDKVGVLMLRELAEEEERREWSRVVGSKGTGDDAGGATEGEGRGGGRGGAGNERVGERKGELGKRRGWMG